jgi:hypothetical protein
MKKLNLKQWWSKNKIGVIFTGLLLISFITIGILINIIRTDKADAKAAKKQHDQNVAALTDSLRVTKDKLGREEFNKTAFVAALEDLKKMNLDLYNEVKAIKGQVKSIAKVTAEIAGDTSLNIATTKEPVILKSGDTAYNYNWRGDTTYSPGNYRRLAGTTFTSKEYNQTKLTEDRIGFKLVTGVKQNPQTKQYEIFAKTDYPGLEITGLEGAVLDPSLFSKPKRKKLITLGAHVGYSPFQYNLGQRKITFDQLITGSVGININF